MQRHTGPYWKISIGHNYTEIDQNLVRNTVSINGWTSVTKEEKPDMDPTSDESTDTDTNLASEASNEDQKTNSLKKFVGHEKTSTRTHYVARWYGCGP